MAQYTPGPEAVDGSYSTGASVDMHNYWARRDWLVGLHQEHKTRVEQVTEIANGNWYTVWPDLSQVPEAPTVANLIELGVNHWSAIGGAILPSIRVPVHTDKDRSEGRRGARKRERRLRELWESSNASELAALLWADYAGAGTAIAGAWANFNEPDPAKRNPYMMRFDPRHTYPIRDDNGNITELLVARKMSKGELATQVPEEKQYLFKNTRSEEIEEWFWFTADTFLHAVVDVSKDGRKANNHVVISQNENKLGFVPVWETVRPTFDGQRRGIFDQTLHIMRTMHRLMMMTIYSTEEHAFPAMLEYDTVNADQFGPGVIVNARSAEARLERISPVSHFDVKDLVARLSDEAQNAAAFPRQLQGDPGASIVSARGISASMGALDARLALAHKQFEILFGKVSGYMLAIDEVYCAGDKTIMGDFRDDRKAESYNPERDVAGAWSVKTTYGIAAGSDPSNIEMRINMNMSNGLISAETGRSQLPFLEDPDAEPIKILREQMQGALVQTILGTGDPTVAAKALKVLNSDKEDYGELLQELVEAIMEAPAQEDPAAAGAPPGMGSDTSADAALGAESLARGGIPGSAEQAPPGLPPLGQLLGQDARLVS